MVARLALSLAAGLAAHSLAQRFLNVRGQTAVLDAWARHLDVELTRSGRWPL